MRVVTPEATAAFARSGHVVNAEAAEVHILSIIMNTLSSKFQSGDSDIQVSNLSHWLVSSCASYVKGIPDWARCQP